jgi:hypothetical protein
LCIDFLQRAFIFFCLLKSIIFYVKMCLLVMIHICFQKITFFLFSDDIVSFESHSWGGVLGTTLCDKINQRLAAGLWFFPVSSILKYCWKWH